MTGVYTEAFGENPRDLHFMKKKKYFFQFVRWDNGYWSHYWPIVPNPMIGEGDCGEIGGMKIRICGSIHPLPHTPS
jgi:hypothetical protein